MRKNAYFSSLAALALALQLCGCRGPAAPEGPVRIGLSIPTQREERWQRDLKQLRTEAEKAGVELLVKVSENSSPRQLEQCEELLAAKIQVLLLAPHDARAAGRIAEKAAARGVKVISYDRLILNAPVDLYVSFDNLKVGELQARHLAAAVPRGAYMLLSGAPTDNNAALFKRGAMRVLDPLIESGQITVAADEPIHDWQPGEAKRLTTKAFAANPGAIRAVLAPNDATAGGVIEALEALGVAGSVAVTGQDADAAAARRILKGTQLMTVFKDTRQLASAAFVAAMSLAAGGPPPSNASIPNGKLEVPALLLKADAVTSANLNDLLILSGYLSRESVYGRAK